MATSHDTTAYLFTDRQYDMPTSVCSLFVTTQQNDKFWGPGCGAYDPKIAKDPSGLLATPRAKFHADR